MGQNPALVDAQSLMSNWANFLSNMPMIEDPDLGPKIDPRVAGYNTYYTSMISRALSEADDYRKSLEEKAERAENRAQAQALQAQSQGFAASQAQLRQQFDLLRDEAARTFQTEERLGGQEYRTTERLGEQEYRTGERLGVQEFQAQQNALDREISRLQAEIALGNLSVNAALGAMQKWLDAQQYTLPEGAQYVPGFQPGGPVSQTYGMIGSPYNPEQYRARPVPFNPAEMVQQTLRGTTYQGGA